MFLRPTNSNDRILVENPKIPGIQPIHIIGREICIFYMDQLNFELNQTCMVKWSPPVFVRRRC